MKESYKKGRSALTDLGPESLRLASRRCLSKRETGVSVGRAIGARKVAEQDADSLTVQEEGNITGRR